MKYIIDLSIPCKLFTLLNEFKITKQRCACARRKRGNNSFTCCLDDSANMVLFPIYYLDLLLSQ